MASSGQKPGFGVPMRNIKSGGIGIDITHSQDTAPGRFPKINRAMVTSVMEGDRLFSGRETALPCPDLLKKLGI
jgi:hypothetical protein